MPDGGTSSAAGWLAAATRPGIAGALESIYAEVARAIEVRGPACWASGRCCNFEKSGHSLYVTGLEAAYAVGRADPAMLTRERLTDALARGGCPFQSANLCGVHAVKPLACRVYFCDRSAQEWQRDLSERMHERVRALHAEHAVEYRYAEWRTLLSMFVATGAAGGGTIPGAPGARPGFPLRILPDNDAS